MLELRGVSKRYGPVVALDVTDLRIEEGNTTVLIGQSGSGKSTLIRLMNGLISPDTGEVLFNGERMTSANVLEIRRKMGYVIQEGGLFPHLTARANVALLARTLGTARESMDQRITDLANLVQLPIDTLSRYPSELSGGQRQRVSLMRALMLDPQVLLLDEPLGALDPMIRADLQEDLKEIFQKLGKTVVMVTHDLGEAVYFGDVVVLLKDGSILQVGPPKDLFERPAASFVSKFVSAQRSPLETMT